ncbi:MAG TPA: HAD-IA family hydrolase [Thermomicrobiales bacterium]|jgi:putative hydrolase of the HAD superfamily
MDEARPIRLVTFDLYDTLIELRPRRWERLAAVLARLGIDADEDTLRAADRLAEDYYTEENGRLPIRNRPRAEREAYRIRYMTRWLDAAGLPADPATVRAAREGYLAEFETAAVADSPAGGYHVFDDVLPALANLRRAGIKRAVISNADADVTALCTHLAFAHDLNAIVTSALVGWEKPDVRTFRAALDPLGVDPADALHIGDQPRSDVAGALATGMRATLLDRYGRHDPAAIGVPVVRTLQELADHVLATNSAAV